MRQDLRSGVMAVAVAVAALAPVGALAQATPPWAGPGAAGSAAPSAAPSAMPGAAPAGIPSSVPLPAGEGAPAAGYGGAAAGLMSQRATGPKAGESLNLTQKAWEDPSKHMGKGQTAPGYTRLQWAADKILPVRTREGLITSIVWPEKENIVQVIVADPASFEAAPSPDKHAIAVKPIYPGVDGNMIVYGSSGNKYNIYMTSGGYNDNAISDMRVSIDVPALGDDGEGSGGSGGGSGSGSGSGGASTTGVPSDDPSAALTRSRARAAAVGRDYSATSETGPGRLRTDLRILVSDPADSIIAPVAAWRDDKFEYLDFGPRAASMNVWPAANLVVDKVETPVGTRTTGPNRSVMVVEALGNLVLRNGTHVVCIKMDDVDQDVRRPVLDEVYRNRPGLAPVVRVAAGPADVAAAAAPAAPAASLVTGPWPLARALALASDIVVGYHGKVTEEQVHILRGGERLTKEAILTAPARGSYEVEVMTGPGIAVERVCTDLRKSHRPCRLR